MASFGVNHAGPGGSTFVIPKLRQPAEERERSGADDVKSHGGSGRGHDRKDAATNSTSTAPVTVRNAARLNVWTGALRFKEETVESVDLYSPFRDCAKPPGFSSSLDVNLLITSVDCQKYAPIVELLNSRTSSVLLRRARVFLCLPQSSSSSTTARSTPMQASYLYLTNTFSPLFARIYERLKSKEIVAMSVLADDTVLLLLPEGKLTERLGIPAHDKPVFHCIFLRPRPDISDDVYRRGLLAMDHIPAEPAPHDKLDGGDESVLVAVDKYRRTCGLPTVKRIAPTPMNSLLSPGKTPPGGKPPTPYIPTPGSSGYMPGKAAEKHRNTYGYHSPQNGQDWHGVHDVLKPPPPPPPPQTSSAEYGVGGVHTPRGILNHGTGGGGLARHPDIVRSPGTEARRAKNQSLFKNALEQMRKINESKSTATASGSPERFQPIIPPLKTPSPAFVPPPPPPPLLATPPDTEQPLPPPPPAPTVPPAILRDPRLHKHGYVVDKPKQQQTTLAAQQHKTNVIPFDVRQNSTQSPPSDPRLKRVSGAAAPSSTLSTPPSFSNLGFKRAYGGVGGVLRNAQDDEPEEKKMLPVVKKPPLPPLQQQQHTIETVDDPTPQQQQHHQIGQQPAAIVCIDETTITECVPMEIDGDDEDSRPYSPSQATPPPSPMEVEKTEKGEEARKEKLDEYDGNGKQKMDEGEKMGAMESEEEQMHDSGHKSPEPTGLERPEQVGIQSPISLVRSIISSPSPKTPPKSERRAKVPPSSASLNASGFGFDFLNWNNSDSPSKEMQSSSSSSSYSSGGLKVDDSFNVEELLKQAEISSVVHKSVAEEQPNDFRMVQLKKKENNNVASPESAENNAPPIPSIVPSLPAKPLAQCLSQPPPQPPPLMAVTITPPPVPPSLVPLSVTNGTGGVHLRPPSIAPSRFVPPTTPLPLQRPSPVAFGRPTVAKSSVRLLHRLDVPPPVLHMPPPPLIRAAGPKNNKMMSTTCTSVVLLDPEAIMCCRIQLNELRAVFAAATRNSVLVLWHQMITAKLIEVGVDAKPYLALADEFVAAGTLERMETHLCDKSGLDLHKLMACTVGVAREQRSRKPEMRVLFLSAMIGAGSDEASDFVANQIEVVSAAQFVEQFK